MWIASNGQFWFCTIALLIVWITVIVTAFENDNNVSSYNENIDLEVRNTRNCKALCEHCGCMGFYCGEECICECNNDHSDTECIATMQTNARKLKIPFELLIQGPTANAFVRNALQFEQNFARKSLSSYRNKRSTVTIYKPNKDTFPKSSTDQIENNSKSSLNSLNLKIFPERSKRSTNQFDWFTDFSNDLVRPAPLGGRKRKVEETKKSVDVPKRSPTPSQLDKSWFSESSLNILTPAPLVKQQISSSSNTGNNKHYNEEQQQDDISLESYKSSEKLFPISIKDTIRKFSESSLSDDLANAFGKMIKDTGDAQNIKKQNNRKYLQEQKRINRFQETLSGGLFKDKLAATPITSLKPATTNLPEFRIPWLRPVNFFKKVKEVISQ